MSQIQEFLLPSDVLLKPSEAAHRIGISMTTFWGRSKNDPDFPPVMHDQKTKMTYLIERQVHDYRLKRLGTGTADKAQRARAARAAKTKSVGEKIAA